jgi:hypothetical protein
VSGQIKSVRYVQQAAYQPSGKGIKGQASQLSFAALGARAFEDGKRAKKTFAGTIAELADLQREAIDDAMNPLCVELCELRLASAELKISNASLREQLSAGHVTDPPSLPLRSSRAN